MDFDFRFSQFEIITGAGTLLLCLFFVSVFTEASAIENEVATQVTEAVSSDELYWSSVEAAGQRVVLTGSAPDAPAQEAAAQRAWSVPGVTAVDNQISIIGQAGTCQRELDNYLAKETIEFQAGKAEVKDSSYNLISMLSMIIRTCTRQIEVAGHTDAKGDAEVNLALR